VAADKKLGDGETDVDTRIAPDPLAAVLPALAALGAIASIAAVHWVAQEKTADRTKSRRRAGVALKDLETCCLGLHEVFKRFARNPKMFGGAGPAGSPLKFGVHGLRVSAEASRQYHTLMNDTASMLVLATQNAFDVMSAIEDGEIAAPEETYFGFGEVQEQLNKLFAARAPLKVCVEVGLSACDRLTILVRDLKAHRVE
jgi:hypothetical protein